MWAKYRVTTESVGDVMRLFRHPRDREVEVEQLFPDVNESLVVEHVEGFVEDAHERCVICPHQKVG